MWAIFYGCARNLHEDCVDYFFVVAGWGRKQWCVNGPEFGSVVM